MKTLPDYFQSACRHFSIERVCRFSLAAVWREGFIIRWDVALEHYTAGIWRTTCVRIGLKEYAPEDFAFAFADYADRCRNSGLDYGIEFAETLREG